MKHYLLLVLSDVEPDIAGPYATEEKRDSVARKFREDYGDVTGIYKLDIDDEGHVYSEAYSGRFFDDDEYLADLEKKLDSFMSIKTKELK